MNRDQYFQRWSELHGGARVSGVVKGWLFISYLIAKPIVRMRISPNFLSVLGVIAAYFVWTQARRDYAVAILALSLISDGVDGTVAILGGNASRRGAMVDALCDRVSEALWAIALYKLGAPAWLVGVAWLCAFTQEYARARIAGLGDFRIDVVTICERPVRAAYLAVALIAYDAKIHFITTIVSLWALQQLIALVTVMRSGYRRLSTPDSVSD